MERELIKLAIKNDLFHMLNKEACEVFLDEMIQDKVLTIDSGKFFLNDYVETSLSLDDFIDEYRTLFSFKRTGVKGRSGNKATIRKKARRFKLETGYTYEQMLALAKYYTSNFKSITTYLVSADYFFYKQDKYKQIHSWAKTLIEEFEQEKKDEQMFNDNLDD